jgi:hypothetical protein
MHLSETGRKNKTWIERAYDLFPLTVCGVSGIESSSATAKRLVSMLQMLSSSVENINVP